MAEFRLRADAESWFKHVANKPPLKTKFDLYYFCLMAGLASQRRSSPSDAQGFVDSMPEDYKQVQEMIVGILLLTEIDRLGVELTERDDVRRILETVVDTSGLSTEGVAKLNEYASGGFDVIQEQGFSQPYHLPEFLLAYNQLLQELI